MKTYFCLITLFLSLHGCHVSEYQGPSPVKTKGNFFVFWDGSTVSKSLLKDLLFVEVENSRDKWNRAYAHRALLHFPSNSMSIANSVGGNGIVNGGNAIANARNTVVVSIYLLASDTCSHNRIKFAQEVMNQIYECIELVQEK